MHIYSHPQCLLHEVAAGHPERPDRLRYLLQHLHDVGLADQYPIVDASAARPEELLLAHPQSHLGFLEQLQPETGVVPVDPDTWLSPNSISAGIFAAGAICDAVRLVVSGADTRAFCAVRPPGHHAEANTAMGFCLYNSVAVGALLALQQQGIQRVAILDFDVHHGNGTVDILKDRPEVLICSSFQHPFYPNRLFDVDRPNIVNTPLLAGTASADFRNAIAQDWFPALDQHQPDLILVSAGFDAHRLDPLANINLVDDDFAWITARIVELANKYSEGRVVSTLEGGYDLAALADSVTAHLGALAQ